MKIFHRLWPILVSIVILSLLWVPFSSNSVQAGPISPTWKLYGLNTGTTGYTIASGTAQQVTLPWNPASFAFCNAAASGGQPIWISFSLNATTMAITSSTSVKIMPQECHTFTNSDPNKNNVCAVSFMTSAATADFSIEATRQ